jgi:predicted CopG family antitoxin
MSTKTIAVDSRVYNRLAREKREGESFSKAIDRLLREVGGVHTGSHVLRALEEIAPLPEEDAAAMLAIVQENRASETWQEHDLR